MRRGRERRAAPEATMRTPSVEVHVSSEGTHISGVVQKNSAGEAMVGATVLELAKQACLRPWRW